MLLLDAMAHLGTDGLEWAAEAARRTRVSLRCGKVDVSSNAFAEVLLRACRVSRALGAPEPFADGRLIGCWADGQLAQMGEDFGDSLRAAVGTGDVTVTFAADAPLGLGFGPLVPAQPIEEGDEVPGKGAEVFEVDDGSAAALAGVGPGMWFRRMRSPSLGAAGDLVELSSVDFDVLLAEIDARRARGLELELTFATAAAADRLYAVEMGAADALGALGATEGLAPPREQPPSLSIGERLEASAAVRFLWREAEPRAFFGDSGSLTAAHTDIAPQLELGLGLAGTKLVGVASHEATPRLTGLHAARGSALGAEAIDASEDEDEDDDYGDDDDDGVYATRVPTDRPLTAHERALLCDGAMSVAVVRAGDLLAFHSGALHFASNGADGLVASIYEGGVTPPLVDRLRRDAAQGTGSAPGGAVGDRYADHWNAVELLKAIECED
jgi:hypothetical protein